MENNQIFSIQNIVPKRYQENLKKVLLSNEFPWYFLEEMWGKQFVTIKFEENAYKTLKVTDSHGFTHMVFDEGKTNSDYFPLMYDVLYFLEQQFNFEIDQILRIRCRMTTQVPGHTKEKYAGPHLDYENVDDFYTLVYYPHDSDGDTILFEEIKETFNEDEDYVPSKIKYKSTPKQGNGLFFKGNRYHAGNYPINCKL